MTRLVLATVISLEASSAWAGGPFSPEGAQLWVHESEGWAQADLLCEWRSSLVYLAQPGSELRRLDVGRGAVEERLGVKLTTDPAQEADCGLGHCWEHLALTSNDSTRNLELAGTLASYYGDWVFNATMKERGNGGTWKALCPGGRPLIWCFTSRRTASVQVGGDPNEPETPLTIDYIATDLEPKPKETLHLHNGKMKVTKEGVEATFSNKGYRYRLTASTSSAAPSAELTVERAGKPIQTEACVAYGVFTRQAEKFAR